MRPSRYRNGGKEGVRFPKLQKVDLKSTLNSRPLDLGAFPHKPRIPSLSFNRNLEVGLHIQVAERVQMDALLIGGTLLGSLLGAFVIQKAALEGLLRVMNTDRRLRH